MNAETRFYQPLRDFFTGLGYAVKGEVKGCDLVALREKQLVVVEFKNRFSLELVLQAVDRRALTDLVYVAIPSPPRRNRRWERIHRLCGLLGLGLLTVDFSCSPPLVVIEQEAVAKAVPHHHKRKTQLLAEFANRQGDPNQGGSVGRQLITAYRQHALAVAKVLFAGPQPLSAIKKQAGEKAAAILQKNYYGWFRRVDRGVYELTDLGRQAVGKH